MSFSELTNRAKLNYVFFWINLIVAFILAYGGSWFCIFSLIVSFLCWSSYKFQDQLEEQTKKVDEE
jgi:hypothetical protein|tara:strand:- start:4084 stop:4281 length:198 start_codon:yes stop_codon:yes gene_type:complete